MQDVLGLNGAGRHPPGMQWYFSPPMATVWSSETPAVPKGPKILKLICWPTWLAVQIGCKISIPVDMGGFASQAIMQSKGHSWQNQPPLNHRTRKQSFETQVR